MGVALTLTVYVVAALAEIGGCFAFWVWLRQSGSPLLLLPGIASLIGFAYALTQIDSAFAGRAFAAYGGVYIIASLIWLKVVEGAPVSRSDAIGAALCLLGSVIIITGLGARS